MADGVVQVDLTARLGGAGRVGLCQEPAGEHLDGRGAHQQLLLVLGEPGAAVGAERAAHLAVDNVQAAHKRWLAG